jgi:hypothetical protein
MVKFIFFCEDSRCRWMQKGLQKSDFQFIAHNFDEVL